MSTPIYELDIDTFGLGGELRVNDLPVLTLPSGRVQARFDVNLAVRTGPNTLAVHLSPDPEQVRVHAEAHCQVRLVERADPHAEAERVHAALELRPAGALVDLSSELDAAAVLGSLELVARQAFELDTPFDPWSWLEAEELLPSEALRAEVIAAYQDIHRKLEARDVDGLLELCAGQAEDYRHAYGLADLEQARALIGIRGTLEQPGLEVEPFTDALLNLQLVAQGRLVRLLDQQRRSPLRLALAEQPGLSGAFNVILARGAQGFEIAR